MPRTPLTVTALAWKYCNNGCGYCISRARKYDGLFSAVPESHKLDFDALVRWILRFVPGCELHVSGGEPLLRPDIEKQILKPLQAGISTTVTTNGMLIKKRPPIIDMPLKWIITRHQHNGIDDWLDNAVMASARPHLATAFINGLSPEEIIHDEQRYRDAGLNFLWSRMWGPRLANVNPLQGDINSIASDVLHLIEPDGTVYACNHNDAAAAIGNIYTMEYDKTRAYRFNERAKQCVIRRSCPAYQTARLLSDTASDAHQASAS